jgi:DNA polymerase-1
MDSGRIAVTRSTFDEVVARLAASRGNKAVDTESTGLMPYKSDRLFSVIVTTESESYYFNFNPYARLDPEYVLPRDWIWRLQRVFDHPDDLWDVHNAKHDMHFLGVEGIVIKGTVHCTRSGARLQYNAYVQQKGGPKPYSLDACLARIDLKKDDAVEEYIKAHGLFEKVSVPGKKQKETLKHYDQVPYEIMMPYGCVDTEGARALGRHQREDFERLAADAPKNCPAPTILLRNEYDITKTVFEMERVGIRLDRAYTEKALAYETERMRTSRQSFEEITGLPLVDSAKTMAKAFPGYVPGVSKKGGPSYNSKVLAKYDHPAAKHVLDFRDAKSKTGFYGGFLYHADRDDVLHPNLNQDGTRSGRMSSSNPNFHNLTDEADELEKNPDLEFAIRKAMVPRPGYFFFNPDFDQMEFKKMLDYSGAMRLIEEVKRGKDVHQATSDQVTLAGFQGCNRGKAKNGNFALIYCAGDKRLAATLGSDVAEAKKLRAAIFGVAPEMKTFIRKVINTASTRGYVFNWAGRRYYFPDPKFAYKAPNYLIQGGCADIVKFRMNALAAYLAGRKSRMLLQVHDEILFEIHESEAHICADLIAIMQDVPYRHLPLTVSASWGSKNWAELTSGMPGSGVAA